MSKTFDLSLHEQCEVLSASILELCKSFKKRPDLVRACRHAIIHLEYVRREAQKMEAK